MLEIVKICRKHGNLLREDCYVRKSNNYFSCRICILKSNDKSRRRLVGVSTARKSYFSKWYSNPLNKEKVRLRSKTWRLNNPEKKKDIQKRWKKKSIKEVRISYIKDLLINRSILSAKDLPIEFINAKMVHLKFKRKLKELNRDFNESK